MLSSRIRGKHNNTKEKAALPQRPHTRAFAKLHGLTVKDVTLDDLQSAHNAAHPPQVSEILPQPAAQQAAKLATKQVEHVRRPINRDLERAGRNSERVVSVAETRLTKRSLVGSRTSARPTESVSAWLEIVDPASPRVSTNSNKALSYSASSTSLDDMESSSSRQTSKSATNDEAASTKASTAKLISFVEHLEFRGIGVTASSDPKLEASGLHDIIQNLPSEVEFRKFDSLMKVLDHYSKTIRKSIKDNGLDNGLPVYDALRYDIGRWRPVSEDYRRFPPMPPEDFDWDRRQCSNSSEADFHRTIMISIVDRYDLQNLFAFSCEEQWAVRHQFLIKPTRDKSKISQPKPDLALSFQRNALVEDDLLDYPVELGKCLHPGNKGHERWFPFVFIEVKRDDNSLRDAFEKSLHSASQALFNIYQWMRLVPELDEQFFNDVRTFSVVLNNETITLRMHRVERGHGDPRLRYRFAEVATVRGYGRFEACHIIKSVLLDYGVPQLYPILRNTYQTVAKMDQPSEAGTKRKQDALATEPSSRSLSEDAIVEEQHTPEPQSADTGLSFDTHNLAVSASEHTPKRSRRRPKRTAG